MRMIISFISECSLTYYFEIIISFWVFTYHSCIKSIHELLIFFGRVVTCTILPHHIRDYGRFWYSEMFYVFIYILISYFYFWH